jgi:hypothetical protein
MAIGLQPFRDVQSIYGSFNTSGLGSEFDGTVQELVFPILTGIRYLYAKIYLPDISQMDSADAYSSGVLHLRCNFYGDPEFPEDLPNDDNDAFSLYGLFSHYTWATKKAHSTELRMSFPRPFLPASQLTGETRRRYTSTGVLMPIICRLHVDLQGPRAPSDGTRWFAYWEVGCA